MSDVVDRPESNAPRADELPSDAVEASAPQQSAAGPAADMRPTSPAAPRPRRRTLRRVLLALGPIVVLVGAAYAYLATGRFVSTDNAYVKSDVGVVSAQISGPIVEVTVRENQEVSQGDELFKIDETPFRVNLDRANAQLGAIYDYVEGIRASYRQKLSQLELDKTNAAYQKRELERLQTLASRQLASQQAVDDARNKSDVASQTVVVTERSLDQIRAQLGGDPNKPLSDQAAYLAVKSMRDTAEIDLERTVVRAPFDGIASKVPMLGHYVAPGVAVMSVVTHVVVGQPVTIELDTYPDRTWQGRVQSIAEATGAEFSVIPAQNATGNWVKVTQRIPVRIAIEARPDDPELRVGMSTVVEIDTGYQRPAPAFLTWLRPGRDAEAAAAPVRLSR